jgi:hypothetical protein
MTGLRARGGLTVDIKWGDGTFTVTIKADRDGRFLFVMPRGERAADLKAGGRLVLRPA